jgi:hypothetical protein
MQGGGLLAGVGLWFMECLSDQATDDGVLTICWLWLVEVGRLNKLGIVCNMVQVMDMWEKWFLVIFVDKQ